MRRIQLSVTEEQYDIINRLAGLREWSMSYVIREALLEFGPRWQREVAKLEPLRERELELEREVARMRAKAEKLAK
jgi:Arc/MetJ-type ribon-helix-helix transcriptional regulator